MDFFMSALIYVGNLFELWLSAIFLSPFRDLNMLWILVPVWFSWFFAEFFQEKTGTSFGNAISNSVIIVWASIDCARQTVSLISGKEIMAIPDIIFRFMLIAGLLGYGISILVLGIKGKPLAKKLGKIRAVTYVFLMFVPVFYNELDLTLNHVLATIVFFPIFFYLIEIIDRILPDPTAVKIDTEEAMHPSTNKHGKGDKSKQGEISGGDSMDSVPGTPFVPPENSNANEGKTSSQQQPRFIENQQHQQYGHSQQGQAAQPQKPKVRFKTGSSWDFKL